MERNAEAALEAIRGCIEDERYTVTLHFTQRMDQRGLMWPDVLAVIEEAEEIVPDGLDDQGRAKWIIGGPACDGLPIDIVCALDQNKLGDWTALFTIYWD